MYLRPYKREDAKTILSWREDETVFRKWTSDRYDYYPITEKDMNFKYFISFGIPHDFTDTAQFFAANGGTSSLSERKYVRTALRSISVQRVESSHTAAWERKPLYIQNFGVSAMTGNVNSFNNRPLMNSAFMGIRRLFNFL